MRPSAHFVKGISKGDSLKFFSNLLTVFIKHPFATHSLEKLYFYKSFIINKIYKYVFKIPVLVA